MLQQYLPILLFIIIAFGMGIAMITAGTLLSPSNSNAEKISPYECGFPPFENARMQFDVRFYLVALLFIIFDLETAFLFPWAVTLDQIGWLGFLDMGLFLGLLVIGFIYEWKKGALEWE